MTSHLERIAETISSRTGVRIAGSRMDSLAAAVERITGLPAARGGAAAASNALDELFDRLIDEITIRETFFLRELDQLRTIDWAALLSAARANGRSRLLAWSAGCASGEEAYTLAMLATESLGPSPPVSVLGTDISGEALGRARAARYTGRTAQRLDDVRLDRHFVRDGRVVSPSPALRELVSFTRHNLTRDPMPPSDEPFDVIVCRNVLIHFEPPAVQRAVAMLAGALAPEGQLVLGSADRLCTSSASLAAMIDRPAPRTPASPERPSRARQPRPAARATRRTGPPERPAPRRSVPVPVPGGGPAPESVAAAVRLADAGDFDQALSAVRHVLERDAADPVAHAVAGIVELANDTPEAAVRSLRRALYLDPTLAVAAFHLGRAQEALGDVPAARRAYEQSLHGLDPDDTRHAWMLGPIDIADVANACSMRLLALRSGPAPEGAA